MNPFAARGIVWGLMLFVVFVAGCRRGANPKILSAAINAMEQADIAFAAKDFPKAAELYATAMSAGGLNADAYCDAAVHRAESLVRTGKLPDADQLLKELEQGATNMAQLHNVQAYLSKKQGNAPQAAEHQRQAKQFDASITPLVD